MWRARAWLCLLALSVVSGGATLVVGSCKLFDVTPPGADAGADAAADVEDAAPPPAPGFVRVETAVRACAQIVGCAPTVARSIQASLAISLDSTNFTHCVDALAGPLDPDRANPETAERLACVASAKDCDAAAACMLYRFTAPPDPRCAGLPVETTICVPGAALSCISVAESVTVGCANPAFGQGASCTLVDAGTRQRGLCLVPSPCPPTPQCLGTVFDHCVEGGHQILDCAQEGHRCVPNQGCVAEECTDQSDTTCATATRMAVCGLTKVTPVDCAHVGARCIKNNTTVACVRDGDECGVFDDPRGERCADGTTIRLCVGGKALSYSCASVGLRCISPAGLRSSYCGP